MRNPPPVSVCLHPASRSAIAWRLAVGWVWAACAAALAAWGAAWQQAPQWQLCMTLAAGGTASVAAVAWAWWAGRHAAATPLRWTGHVWQCGDAVITAPRVRLDLGSCMLVELPRTAASVGSRWWVLTYASDRRAWHPFRAAVYAHARPDEPLTLETMASGPHLREDVFKKW